MIVPAGAPLSPGQMPLYPTRIRTIEGPERFGGSFRRPTGGAGVMGGGRLLRGLGRGLGSNLRMRGRGLGANVQYCDYNPPDAATAAQIAAAGNTYSLISCAAGTTTNPADPGGVFTNSATAYVGPQPVETLPPTPAYADCSPLTLGGAGSTACTAANLALQTAWQNAVQAAQQKYNAAMCVWNGENPTYCQQLYSGAGGASGSPGAGVVPTAPQYLSTGAAAGGNPSLVMVDSNTGAQNPSQVAVGDSWLVKVSGVAAGATITATINGPSGSSQYTAGTADSSGSLTLSGSAMQSQVGAWTEQWSANGQPIGTLSFSIAAGSAGSGSGAGSGGSAGSGSGSGSGSGGGTLKTPAATPFDLGAFLTGSAIGGIPNWALVAGGIAIVVLMAGGKH